MVWGGQLMCTHYLPPSRELRSDVSGSFGCGAVNPPAGEWLQFLLSAVLKVTFHQLQEDSIILKEIIPIVSLCCAGLSVERPVCYHPLQQFWCGKYHEFGVQRVPVSYAAAEVLVFPSGFYHL